VRSFMLSLGLGAAVIAAGACHDVPTLPLARGATRNDTATVRQLLAERHAVDETDRAGLSALMWAARLGAVDAMAALLDGGANVNARATNRNSWTALQHAVHRRQVDAVRLLLDRGADPDGAVHSEALTPLLMAAGDPDPSVVKALLAHGADPRRGGEWGDTPLTRAVSGGALGDIDRPLLGGCHPATVRALLEHDPTLRLPDTFAGREALWWARFHGCAEVLELIDREQKSAGLTHGNPPR
jgi:ankyrin repeat protein